MNRKFLTCALIIITAFGIGAVISYSLTSRMDTGTASLVHNSDHLRQLLELSDSEMVNDGCYPPKGNNAPYHVSDFIIGYLEFFTKPTLKKQSFSASCGFREENLCSISYGARNVEGDKGTSWNLWYRIDPQTGKIDPEYFECWGL